MQDRKEAFKSGGDDSGLGDEPSLVENILLPASRLKVMFRWIIANIVKAAIHK